MSLKKTYETISKKAAEAEKQKAEITRKLEANKNEKARAEAAKAAALEAKDEEAYKQACRAIADADAGIEFNTICLNEFQKKQLASEADDAQIKRQLQQGAQELYMDAIIRFEKMVVETQGLMETTMQRLREVAAMAHTWDEGIMRNIGSTYSAFSHDKLLALQGINNGIKARLNQLDMIKKANASFREGGR